MWHGWPVGLLAAFDRLGRAKDKPADQWSEDRMPRRSAKLGEMYTAAGGNGSRRRFRPYGEHARQAAATSYPATRPSVQLKARDCRVERDGRTANVDAAGEG